jgi:hypothetical protein
VEGEAQSKKDGEESATDADEEGDGARVWRAKGSRNPPLALRRRLDTLF